jgi:hypothetical protein
MDSTLWFKTDEPWTNFGGAVICVCTGDLEENPKYGQEFLSVNVTPETAPLIGRWCEHKLHYNGGYVHLLFVERLCPGDDETEGLKEMVAEWDEDEEYWDELSHQAT